MKTAGMMLTGHSIKIQQTVFANVSIKRSTVLDERIQNRETPKKGFNVTGSLG